MVVPNSHCTRLKKTETLLKKKQNKPNNVRAQFFVHDMFQDMITHLVAEQG